MTPQPHENKVSLGLLEGFNKKVHAPSGGADSYRNEDYLKLKIVAVFLPSLTRSAEKDSL